MANGKQVLIPLISDYGNLPFGPGKMISEKEFEYSFDLDYVKNTHKGTLKI